MTSGRPKRVRKARPLRVGAGASLHATAQAAFAEIAAHYAENLTPAASLPSHPERVHQARVALRRLRVALWVYAPLLGEARARTLSREARAQFRVLGSVRDLDVLLASPLLANLPPRGGAARVRALRARRRAAALRARGRLTGPSAARFARAVAALPSALSVTAQGAQKPAATHLTTRLDVLHEKLVKSAKRAERDQLDALHDLRKRGKRLRYATELAAPAFPQEAKRVGRLLRALAQLQDLLGDYLDGALAMRAVRAVDRQPEIREALDRAQARAARALGDDLPKRTRAIQKVRPFW